MKIEDPIAWMNARPRWLVDFWIAYEAVISDERKGKESNLMDPAEALKPILRKHG